MSANLKSIFWTLRTGGDPTDGTDTRISAEIWCDNRRLENLWEEPGNTFRLNRGEVATRGWEFPDPGEHIDHSIRGSLKVVFRAWGDDLWKALDIDSEVTYDVFVPTPSVHWVRRVENFSFPGSDMLSTDSGEGVVTLTLNY